VDVEATTSIRQAEVTAQRRMIERAHDRFGLWPERLAADAGYGDAPNLAWLVEDKGISPHIPVFDKSARTDGTFERSAFTFDHEDDSYVCPSGKRLRPRNPTSIRTASSGTVPVSRTAAAALCGKSAHPICPPARLCARSMKARATWLAISPPAMPT
jgi:hypothetical protein